MVNKTSKTPLRQLYFGEKPILIEKNWKAWLGDPAKLEENLKVWHKETLEIKKENQRLRGEITALKKAQTKSEQNWLQKEQDWLKEKTSLETQKESANNSSQRVWEKYSEALDYQKKTYTFLGRETMNSSLNRPLVSFDMLKWWLRKTNTPTTDKDYWTFPELFQKLRMMVDPTNQGTTTDSADTREPIIKPNKISTYLYEVKFWKKESINAKGELIVDNFWLDGEEFDGVFVEGKYADMKVLENLENESFIWNFDKYVKTSFFDRKFLIVYYDSPWTFTKISSQDTQTDETDTREPNIQKTSTIVKLHDTTWKQRGGIEAILELKVEPFYFKRVLFDGTILVKGKEDEIKILENWKGKSINWSFDKFKTLIHYGNWKLTVYHTDYWKLVEIGEQSSQTDIHSLMFVDLERASENFITQQVALKTELLKNSDAKNLRVKLKELEPYFNCLQLPNTYQLLTGIYVIAIENKEELTQFLILQKVANLEELGQKIKKLWDDITQEQNKTKQLEIQITNKDNDISQKDKTIQSLQLKNEKLTENQKKLYSYLGDAWKLISHLRKDLAVERQEKENLQQDITELQAKVKDLTFNETEKQLMVYAKWKDWKKEDYEIIKKELETGQTPYKTWDWNQLRGDFIEVRNKLLLLVITLIEQNREKEHIQQELNNALAILNKPTTEMGTQTDLTAEQITQMEQELASKRTELINLREGKKWEDWERDAKYQQKEQELSQLQTKYDQEVKTKGELVEELRLARKYFGQTLHLNIVNSHLEKEKIDEVKKILKTFHPFHVNLIIGTNISNYFKEDEVFDFSFFKDDLSSSSVLKANWTINLASFYFPPKLKLILFYWRTFNFVEYKSYISGFWTRCHEASNHTLKEVNKKPLIGDLCEFEYEIKKE